MIRLSSGDIHTFLQPSRCELRVYLKERKITESPPGPYETILRNLGERHEAAYFKSLTSCLNLAIFPTPKRLEQTLQAIQNKVPVLYHPLFRIPTQLDDQPCEIWGEPDFLLWDHGRYIIQDVKICRSVTPQNHPEILHQLSLYGWLYEKTTVQPPGRLEVVTGTGDVVELPYTWEATQSLLRTVVQLRKNKSEPETAVGWSKCTNCQFRRHCWPKAEKKMDVALVAELDQGLALALKAKGIQRYTQLIQTFDAETLANFSRPWGSGTQKVGKKAKNIILNARALTENREIFIQKPILPDSQNYLMFDLEGLPPQLDEFQKIYLWGMQVYGRNPGGFEPALAGLGAEGDRAGWFQFLEKAGAIFSQYGDIPFIHWAHYEKTNINMYLSRYGDSQGIAARVLGNLWDLLPITKASVALPLPSYSLKVVEKYIGFKRTMETYGGDWSIAKYIEAVNARMNKNAGNC